MCSYGAPTSHTYTHVSHTQPTRASSPLPPASVQNMVGVRPLAENPVNFETSRLKNQDISKIRKVTFKLGLTAVF